MKKVAGYFIFILGVCGFVFSGFFLLLSLFYSPSARLSLINDFSHLVIVIIIWCVVFISYIIAVTGLALFNERSKRNFLKFIIWGSSFLLVIISIILLSWIINGAR